MAAVVAKEVVYGTNAKSQSQKFHRVLTLARSVIKRVTDLLGKEEITCSLVLMKTTSAEFPGGLVVKDSDCHCCGPGFNPWPGNLCLLQVQPRKRKEKNCITDNNNNREQRLPRQVMLAPSICMLFQPIPHPLFLFA